VDVSSERNDQNTLIPLLEQHEIGCYIKPANYERSKTRKYKSNMALRENMSYDARADAYTCQNGR